MLTSQTACRAQDLLYSIRTNTTPTLPRDGHLTARGATLLTACAAVYIVNHAPRSWFSCELSNTCPVTGIPGILPLLRHPSCTPSLHVQCISAWYPYCTIRLSTIRHNGLQLGTVVHSTGQLSKVSDAEGLVCGGGGSRPSSTTLKTYQFGTMSCCSLVIHLHLRPCTLPLVYSIPT